MTPLGSNSLRIAATIECLPAPVLPTTPTYRIKTLGVWHHQKKYWNLESRKDPLHIFWSLVFVIQYTAAQQARTMDRQFIIPQTNIMLLSPKNPTKLWPCLRSRLILFAWIWSFSPLLFSICSLIVTYRLGMDWFFMSLSIARNAQKTYFDMLYSPFHKLWSSSICSWELLLQYLGKSVIRSQTL